MSLFVLVALPNQATALRLNANINSSAPLPLSSVAKVVTSVNGASIDTTLASYPLTGETSAGKFVAASSQYLSTPASTDWQFGSSPFTIDFWINWNSIQSGSSNIIAQDGGTNVWELFQRSAAGGSGLRFQSYASSTLVADYYTGAYSWTTGSWYHVAVVWDGTTFHIFINGVSQSLTTGVAFTSNNFAASLYVGGDPVAGTYMNGWMDEVRISKGARWTSNFTPPTSEYSADTYTVLLLHMNGSQGSTTFTDSSANIPPPTPDFTISGSPGSQSVYAGSTATFSLLLAGVNGYGTPATTIALTVSSGCPSGVSCTIMPNSIGSGSLPTSATLTVPTLITTPGGSTTVTVSASDGTITNTASVTLTVIAPTSYSFNVRVGATQVVVTVTGTASASVTIAGPGNSPILIESGATAYDKLVFVTGSSTPIIVHRVTFSITAPTSAQAWTALVSTTATSPTVAVEVS